MLTNREHDNSYVKAFFRDRGWQVVKLAEATVNLTETHQGEDIRCMDERYGNTKEGYDPILVPLAPAWPGAIRGIEVHLNGRSFEERTRSAVGKIRGIGFRAGVHGDEHHEIRGCGFSAALIDRRFANLPPISEVEVRQSIRRNGMEHRILLGSHTAQGLLINTQPFTTIVPDGNHFIADAWFPWMLGINPQKALEVLAVTAELLLPPRSRKLYLPQ